MSSPFVAEIRIFCCNFAPRGWATCDGQLLPISQNTALFSLLGTFYGGNGLSNFALPNLQGSIPIHPGQGPGLSQRFLGEQGGSEFVTLLQSEIPSHNHAMGVSATDALEPAPVDQLFAKGIGVGMYAVASGITQLNNSAIAPSGGNLPHNNMMPYLAVLYCIAMQGVFPPRQ